MKLSAEGALVLVATGLAYVGVLSSAEFFANRHLVAPGGLLGWDVLQTRTRVTTRLASTPWTGWIGGPTGWNVLCVLRGLAAVLALPITGAMTTVSGVALTVLGLTTLLIMYRAMYGLDGSDQLVAVLALAAGASILLDSDAAVAAFCWFAASLVTIAYVTAGMTKLLSATWRRGEALALVMRTEVYGNPSLAIHAQGAIGRLATRAVVVIELAFPLAFTGSTLLTLTLLGVLTVFHITSAAVMGLNCFLPAYVCTFGCVFWCSQQLWG